MAQTYRAPKQWCLSWHETLNSFKSWKENIIYTLSLDPDFTDLLKDDVTWLKKSPENPLRGFVDDATTIPVATRKSATQKVCKLELLLGQIANFCPVISRNQIIRNSTLLSNVWQSIRLHFGFQSTGGQFLDIADVALQADERPEDLFQRLSSFAEDSLLYKDGSITHHGEHYVKNEYMSPTLENFVVLYWLRLLHKDLPKLVKQRYSTELRSRTLSS